MTQSYSFLSDKPLTFSAPLQYSSFPHELFRTYESPSQQSFLEPSTSPLQQKFSYAKDVIVTGAQDTAIRIKDTGIGVAKKVFDWTPTETAADVGGFVKDEYLADRTVPTPQEPSKFLYPSKSKWEQGVDYAKGTIVESIKSTPSNIGAGITAGTETLVHGLGGPGTFRNIKELKNENIQIEQQTTNWATTRDNLLKDKVDDEGFFIGTEQELKEVNKINDKINVNVDKYDENQLKLKDIKGSEFSWAKNIYGSVKESKPGQDIGGAISTVKKWVEKKQISNEKLADQLAGLSVNEAIESGAIREYGNFKNVLSPGGPGMMEFIGAGVLNIGPKDTSYADYDINNKKLTRKEWLDIIQRSKKLTTQAENIGITAIGSGLPFTKVTPFISKFGPQSSTVVTKGKQLFGYEISKELFQNVAETPLFTESSNTFVPTFLQYSGQATVTKIATGGPGPWLATDIGYQAVKDPYAMYESFADKDIFWEQTVPAILGYGTGDVAGTRVRGKIGEGPMAWSDALSKLKKDIKNKKIDIVEQGKYEQTILPGSNKVVIERTKKLTQAESNALFEKDFLKNSKDYTQQEIDFAVKEIRQGKYPTVIKDAYRSILEEAQGLIKLKPNIKRIALRQIEWTGKYGTNLKDGVIRYSQGGGVGQTGLQPRFLGKMKKLAKRQGAITGGSLSQTAWNALKQFAGDWDLFVKNPKKAAKEMYDLLVREKAEKSIQVGFKVNKITLEGSKIYAEGIKGDKAKLIEYHFENPPFLTDIVPNLPTIKFEQTLTKTKISKSKLWDDLLGMEDTLSRTAFGFAEAPIRTPGGEKIVTPREQYMRTIVGALEGRAGKDIPKLTQMREEYYGLSDKKPPFEIFARKSQQTDVQPWSIKITTKPGTVFKEETITRKSTKAEIKIEEQLIARKIMQQEINKYKTEKYVKPKPGYKPHEYYKDYYYKKPYYNKEYYDKKYYDKYYSKQYYSPKYYGKGYYDDYYNQPYYDKGYYGKYTPPYKTPKKIIIPSKNKEHDVVRKKLTKKKRKYFNRYSASLGGLVSGSTKKPKIITGIERRGSKADYSKQVKRLTGL